MDFVLRFFVRGPAEPYLLRWGDQGLAVNRILATLEQDDNCLYALPHNLALVNGTIGETNLC